MGIVLKSVALLGTSHELLTVIGGHLLLSKVLNGKLLGDILNFLTFIVVKEVCMSLHIYFN